MAVKTHWKKLRNPDFLGAYSFEDGKDIIATIKAVRNEVVVGPDGKKEECTVVYFVEDVKPFILNATNAKVIQKLYKTPYVEEWQGKKIEMFATTTKAFGDVTECVRIRAYVPKDNPTAPVVAPVYCEDCKKEIQGFGKNNAAQIAAYTKQKYGKALCSECAKKHTPIDDSNTDNTVEG